MPEQQYGKRTCLQCGHEFDASYPAQLTCSEKCALERRREQGRQSDALSRARNKNLLTSLDEAWAELEWLNCRYEARRGETGALMIAMCAAHALEIQKLKAELDALRLASVQPAPAEEKAPASPAKAPAPSAAASIDTSDWDFCERMSLRARRLPCGEREECQGCERITTDSPVVLEPGEKLCKQCKKPFTPKAPAQKYCSKSCQEDAAKAKIYGGRK